MLTAFDKFTRLFAPRWTLKRVQAREALALAARHYEAASPGRRTSGWARNRADANAVNAVALAELRWHARDLVQRNDGWARKAVRTIADNAVGAWGFRASVKAGWRPEAEEAWRMWTETTDCDADGRLSFAGLQHLAARAIVTDGEVFIRRRWRRTGDGLALPIQLQVLEADYLDSTRDADTSLAGGPIIQGVEFDKVGRRAAYWLFPQHPGSVRATSTSRRVPAAEVLHVYWLDRPGQVRAPSWFAAAIVPLKDLGEFEDADLVRQKIAACFAAFVTDADGAADPMGEASTDGLMETLEPGMIQYLTPGKEVTFGTPPALSADGFTSRVLRKIAAALGVTYEDLTGDYSSVKYMSGRMMRSAHWASVRTWQWHMLVPQLCHGVWRWASEAAELARIEWPKTSAEWTAQAQPLLDPAMEGQALARSVRAGLLTPSGMLREQGEDPRKHWQEYADDLKQLDDLGIVLDSDARKTTSAGQARTEGGEQQAQGSGS